MSGLTSVDRLERAKDAQAAAPRLPWEKFDDDGGLPF